MSINAPENVPEMLSALLVLESKYPKLENVPWEESLLMAHSFIQDICERLLVLENELKALKK